MGRGNYLLFTDRPTLLTKLFFCPPASCAIKCQFDCGEATISIAVSGWLYEQTANEIFSGYGQGRGLPGEARLLLGVLTDVVSVIVEWVAAVRHAANLSAAEQHDIAAPMFATLREDYKEALAWLNTKGTGLNRDPPWVAYDDVCDGLGLDAVQFRKELQKYRHHREYGLSDGLSAQLNKLFVARERMVQLNNDPAFVPRRDAVNRDPAVLAQRSITMTGLHTDNAEFRASSAAAASRNMTLKWADKEFRAANSERTKRRWAEFRARKAQLTAAPSPAAAEYVSKSLSNGSQERPHITHGQRRGYKFTLTPEHPGPR
jgi:hypothetical protein